MLKAKNGKLIRLCKDDQDFLWESYLEGGTHITYNVSYAGIKKAHCLLVTDNNNTEVCALISKNVTRIVALTGDDLLCGGMPLADFIRKYCPDYVDKLDEVEAQP